MSELRIDEGDLTINDVIDKEGCIVITIGCGRENQYINRDDALKIITHLFNVFNFEIHATIIPSKPT